MYAGERLGFFFRGNRPNIQISQQIARVASRLSSRSTRLVRAKFHAPCVFEGRWRLVSKDTTASWSEVARLEFDDPALVAVVEHDELETPPRFRSEPSRLSSSKILDKEAVFEYRSGTTLEDTLSVIAEAAESSLKSWFPWVKVLTPVLLEGNLPSGGNYGENGHLRVDVEPAKVVPPRGLAVCDVTMTSARPQRVKLTYQLS